MFPPSYTHKRNLKMCFGPAGSFGLILMSLVIKQTNCPPLRLFHQNRRVQISLKNIDSET